MTSTLVSDYQDACSEFVRDAVRRPSMYFKSLEELELLFFGHQVAFEQLGVITRDQSFNTCFMQWIRHTTGVSGSAGWAYAIEKLIAVDGRDANSVLFKLAEEFLCQWGDEMTTN